MLPPLPHELTTDILKLATLSLVEQERHDSTITGQTNAFLLSASLVSHTWRNIAQPLLLKHGLVDPSRALHFIGEHARAGLKDTLAGVRIGVSASRTMSDVDARAGGIGLRAILEELPALRALEFVGQRLRLLGFASKPNRITNLSFVASSLGNFDGLLLSLRNSFTPLQLIIIEDPDSGDGPAPLVLALDEQHFLMDEVDRIVKSVQDLSFTMKTKEALLYPMYLLSHPTQPLKTIDSFRLEIEGARTLEIFRITMRVQPRTSLDFLKRVETHLDWLRDSAGLYGPNLTVIKILWDPVGFQSTSTITAEDQILSQISNLAGLKELEVPDCWRSDAIEAACEAKGVALSWTLKMKGFVY